MRDSSRLTSIYLGEVDKFEAGQTWLWEGRMDPDLNWTLWHVLDVSRDWLQIVTLASGKEDERTDAVGFTYHIPDKCIMAEDSKRVA